MHWILDCVEWKKRNEQNEVQGDDQMNYVPGINFLIFYYYFFYYFCLFLLFLIITLF